MSSEHIQATETDGIVTITLNRPEKLNAFAGHMRRDLAEMLEAAASDRTVRVIVLTGAGRAFCAGGDVASMNELAERGDTEEFQRLLGAGRRVVLAIRHTAKPVVASINGPTSGAGFNLALACDIRIASTTATFSQSFVKIGLHPDWGGTYFLPRIVGPSKAMEMFMLGDQIGADEALRIGILNRVVDPGSLDEETRLLAERLRDAPPVAVAAIKHAVYASDESTLEEMIRFETEAQIRCFTSNDCCEGIRAFLEKRAPRFSGK